jgi:ketosteroid isomerase-like protein
MSDELKMKRLEELLAKQEITEVMYRYCRGADRCDVAMMASCYHEDATDQHGFFSGNGREFCKHAISTLRRLQSSNHRITNVLIEIEGERAFAESYVHVVHRPILNGTVTMMEHYGRYLDVFERRGGEWKIKHRQYVQDSNQITQAASFMPDENEYTLVGKRFPDDAVYAKFDLPKLMTRKIVLDINWEKGALEEISS